MLQRNDGGKKRGLRHLVMPIITSLYCALGSVAANAASPYDCPALASNELYHYGFSGYCRVHPGSKWQTTCDAMKRYKPRDWTDNLLLLDSTVMVSFEQDLRAAGANTPACRELVDSEKLFEQKLLACGKDGDCILKVLRARAWALAAWEEKLQGPELSEEAVERFLGNVHLPWPGEEKPIALQNRIFQGLDPRGGVAVPGDRTLFWGFEPHNARLQSLVLQDRQGKILLVGAVDGTYGEYPEQGEKLKFLMEGDGVRLFVRDPRVLPSAWPVLQSWLAADLLFFENKCSGQAPAQCRKAQELVRQIPVTAYDLNCLARGGKAQSCTLPLPAVRGSGISPSLFAR